MTKSSMNWWERFLFRDKGILPTRKLLVFMLILSVSLVMASFWGVPWTFILICNISALLISFLDLMYLPKRQHLSFKRRIPSDMERGVSYPVVLEVNNMSEHGVTYRLVDGLPQSFTRPFPLKGSVEKQSNVVTTYETMAPIRGSFHVDQLYFRYRSKFSLWEKQSTVLLEDTVKVIPDLTDTKEFLENAQKFLLHEGVQIRKQISSVGEFANIRNYVVGDDPRKINWRQTAKLQEVMTNDYEPEHGKHITLLIDCGRMMGVELKVGNRLDRTIEAAIAVAAAALKKGDYVAVLAFSRNTKIYVPPAKGMNHLQMILRSVYDIQVDGVESNYGEVFHYLQTVQKKRSLIMLFSDIRTFLYDESTLAYLKRLRQRHLFLMIGIEDKVLAKRVKDQPTDLKKAMVKSIAQQQTLFKKREKLRWEKQGLQMLEAQEDKLAVTAISNYLHIMNRGLL
ncbi:DUF58 domain-containing protein [Evansella sp. AB-rgal1]|uniref:DUF58 domain-containing protein n=1 Tax=Evansella sp. AB-rgal1 TaxID=3242696 RepID=UPI00359E3351